MNNKITTLLLGLLATGATVLLIASAREQPTVERSPSVTGRYQLIAARVTTSVPQTVELHNLYRLDTMTGMTERLVSRKEGEGTGAMLLDHWQPVIDYVRYVAALTPNTNQANTNR